ncbi:amidohydrolase family protein [Salinarimonas ramus]|uniref:Hydrolase n=1 Tax=Salinarimonas ramus TaxID=690164 RepID=A0A917Q6Q7_9HYPH|nr:amidohydrolase family protein [Salinarimonas ramus]GGK31960.1 hydrolase [Salinarimonas ramus]
MEDILVTGATILTLDADRRVIPDGAMAVSGGRIVAVGPREEVEASHPVARIVDGRGKVLMPGLIDVHAHAGHGLIKSMGMTDGDAWERICGEVYTTGSTPGFWYAEARLASLERLRFGVTCGVSLLGGGDTVMRTDDPAYGDAHCRGVAEIGTRSVVAVGPTRAPHPWTYATITEDGGREVYPVDFDRQMRTCRALIDTWHGGADGRIRMALVYPVLRDEHERTMAPADYEEAIRQVGLVRALSREAKLLFTQDGHWRGSVRRAHALGLLGPDALLSHAIDLDADEIAMCAETGTRIAHNPSAVASIKGRCPAIELMEAGAVVALGSDATAPDRSSDMFRHMQQAMHYHRRHYRDASVLPVGKTLEMATIDAATALGMEAEIGSLEPGKRADAILVDMRRAHLAPANMPVHRLVAFANGNDVDTVMVDGEILLQGGRPTRVDPVAIVLEAEREAELMIARIGAEAALDIPAGWGRVRL